MIARRLRGGSTPHCSWLLDLEANLAPSLFSPLLLSTPSDLIAVNRQIRNVPVARFIRQHVSISHATPRLPTSMFVIASS